MNKIITFKEKNEGRIHSRDDRIYIEENILQVVKTLGFNHLNENQESLNGYIQSHYVMEHAQWNNFYHHNPDKQRREMLDCCPNDDKDYEKRREDFKKLMKNIDVSDDEIFGPYSRDADGKKLIGDVVEYRHRDKDRDRFKSLCRRVEQSDGLIEIEYLGKE